MGGLQASLCKNVIIRPGVAGADLQTALLLMDWLIHLLTHSWFVEKYSLTGYNRLIPF